jgi:hypothetical protein
MGKKDRNTVHPPRHVLQRLVVVLLFCVAFFLTLYVRSIENSHQQDGLMMVEEEVYPSLRVERAENSQGRRMMAEEVRALLINTHVEMKQLCTPLRDSPLEMTDVEHGVFFPANSQKLKPLGQHSVRFENITIVDNGFDVFFPASSPKRFDDLEFSCYSQTTEDGALMAIFQVIGMLWLCSIQQRSVFPSFHDLSRSNEQGKEPDETKTKMQRRRRHRH